VTSRGTSGRGPVPGRGHLPARLPQLRQKLDTPILQTEHVRGLEPFSDFAATGSTDFLRADPEYDAGITGAIKRARVAEGFGLDV
jgi:L-alanine-DL-glutamate epimerase-like enolase superfamily enzyme